MNLDTQTKLAAKLVNEISRLGSAGWDKSNHYAYLFLMDLSAHHEISQSSLTSYFDAYHEQVDEVDQWLNKDFEVEVRIFSDKLAEYRENPSDEQALKILKK